MIITILNLSLITFCLGACISFRRRINQLEWLLWDARSEIYEITKNKKEFLNRGNYFLSEGDVPEGTKL